MLAFTSPSWEDDRGKEGRKKEKRQDTEEDDLRFLLTYKIIQDKSLSFCSYSMCTQLGAVLPEETSFCCINRSLCFTFFSPLTYFTAFQFSQGEERAKNICSPLRSLYILTHAVNGRDIPKTRQKPDWNLNPLQRQQHYDGRLVVFINRPI